jgi:hypothetical protein
MKNKQKNCWLAVSDGEEPPQLSLEKEWHQVTPWPHKNVHAVTDFPNPFPDQSPHEGIEMTFPFVNPAAAKCEMRWRSFVNTEQKQSWAVQLWALQPDCLDLNPLANEAPSLGYGLLIQKVGIRITSGCEEI